MLVLLINHCKSDKVAVGLSSRRAASVISSSFDSGDVKQEGATDVNSANEDTLDASADSDHDKDFDEDFDSEQYVEEIALEEPLYTTATNNNLSTSIYDDIYASATKQAFIWLFGADGIDTSSKNMTGFGFRSTVFAFLHQFLKQCDVPSPSPPPA